MQSRRSSGGPTLRARGRASPRGCSDPMSASAWPGTNGPRQRKQRKTGQARLQLLDWTILLTNVPASLLSVDEALVLARCRWQIELCWKVWKQLGKLDTWRSAKPYRILTEIYAKLLGGVITHWVTLLECWQAPNHSTVKARQVVHWMASVTALGVDGILAMETMVPRTAHTMALGSTDNPRRNN